MKRFQNKRLITLGVYERIPEPLQLMMWLMVEGLEEQDYLQVFELQKTSNGVLICQKYHESTVRSRLWFQGKSVHHR